MTKPIRLGTAVARPGTIQYGEWDAITHPTGHDDYLPVIIAQGKEPGPCIWLTAGIHGPEHTGPTVLYRLLTEELVDVLRGTIVVLPALSPAGLRTKEYVPYHLSKNPNRMWPEVRPPRLLHPDEDPPSSVELAFARLFDCIHETADLLIDYHNAWIDSMSFVFRDRMLYRPGDDEADSRASAEALSHRLDEMIAAYGHTVVNELPIHHYLKQDLHRSTSGAALLVAGIPSFTVELGAGLAPDRAMIAASLAGTRNVLRWANMLPGDMEPIRGVRVVDLDFPVRTSAGARAPEACVALHLVQSGDRVQAGQPLAELCDVWGRPLPGSPICAQHDGFVIGREHGIYYYPGDTILFLAIPDEDPLVAPYPPEFYD